MKPLLVLLTFTILSSSLAAVVTLSEFEKDLNNFEHLNFGVDALLNKGREVGKIVDGLFDITRIYNISSELDYYDFIIQLDDGKESVIQATLRVQVEGDQATRAMSFSYTVTNTNSGTTETGTDADVPETPGVETLNEETEISVPVEIPNEETAIVVEAPLGASPNEETEIVVETPLVTTPNEETVIIIPDVIPIEETDITIETPFGLDPDVQEALDFGFQSVIQTGQNQNKIKTGEDYQVTTVNSWNEEPTNNRVDYTFDVTATNSKGNIIIQMTFTVSKNSDGDMSVPAYNYHVSTTTSGDDDIGPDTEIPPSQYTDPEIREALVFGRDYVLQSGQNKGKIPTGESYYMSNINSIIQETGDNEVRYKFDITMENTPGNIVIEMKYTVSRSSSGELKVVAYGSETRTTS